MAKDKFVWDEDDFEIVARKAYDPNQPRNQQGEWTADGADGGTGTGDKDSRLGAANWTMPDEKSLKQEYAVEYQHHFKYTHGDRFPTEADFLSAIKDAPIVTVDRKLDRQISGRSRTGSMGSLLSLIRGYRSYPKYRNEKTLAALEQRIKSGQPTDYPIVTNDNGHMQVFSGNTRMDIGFWHAPAVKVIMLDVGKYKKFNPYHGEGGRFASAEGAGDHIDSLTRTALAGSGGFTFNAASGKAPKEGIAVGGYGTRDIFDAESYGKADLMEYLARNADALKGNYLGGWVDKGKVYLDVTKVFPTSQKAAAIKAAKERNQIAVADLGALNAGRMDEAFIDTGGTGKAATRKPEFFVLPATLDYDEIHREIEAMLARSKR